MALLSSAVLYMQKKIQDRFIIIAALLLSISLSFYLSTPLPDTSVHPRTHAPPVFLSSKLIHVVKVHSPSQAQLNGIYCPMDSDTPNLLQQLKQISKPTSSDLRTNLRYPLDAVCMCVRACVRVCARASMDFYVCTMLCESCLMACF